MTIWRVVIEVSDDHNEFVAICTQQANVREINPDEVTEGDRRRLDTIMYDAFKRMTALIDEKIQPR